MNQIHRSLWLPIGPANFFSAMTDPELLATDGDQVNGRCRAHHEPGTGYVPHLRESVFRRLVEVLPASFGYDVEGRCQFSTEQDDRSRPVSLTMVRRPGTGAVQLAQARPADLALAEAGVTEVRIRVDEHGFYAFTATAALGADADQVGRALLGHVVQFFGGTFAVNRLSPSADRHRVEGRDAVREYNGLPIDQPPAGTPESPLGPPSGALSFYQLNILAEGLCNESLLPAVFFEHYEQARLWLDEHRRTSSVVTRLADLVRVITVSADAGTPLGQMITLHRFLLISRGSLQWMRRSVESVRRSLLDQMMAVSHRQSRLIQLDLSGVEYERTPEMTGDATESQLRGYVMLIATKLPLVGNITDAARAAARAVHQWLRQSQPDADQADALSARDDELMTMVESWADTLQLLRANVNSLETAVGHDWQERLLYEQEQARSEQEALAEIERSRRGRPEHRRTGDVAYNAIMLLLTVAAVFVAIPAAVNPPSTSQPWWQQILSVWPVALIGVLVFVAWPIVAGIRRLYGQQRPNSDLYSFEFAFRLDERAEQQRVQDYLNDPNPLRVASTVAGRIKIRRMGGWRWERISADTTLLKIHSIAVVRLRRFRYARFEIVTEIMVRRISTAEQFFLRQCRMFGDTPIPLTTPQIGAIVGQLLELSCRPLSDDLHVATLTDPIHLLRQGTGTLPTQRRGGSSRRRVADRSR